MKSVPKSVKHKEHYFGVLRFFYSSTQLILNKTPQPFLVVRFSGIINVLKLPATNIPMGLDSSGLPIGLQVVSKENNDRLCLVVANELEKAFGGWVPPEVQA